MPDRILDSFHTSPQQERLFAAEPSGPAACVQALLAIAGAVDADAITDALRRTVARHESLRTTFAYQPGLTLPLQTINPQLEPRIQTLDASGLDPQQRAQRVLAARRSELEEPFDLERGPLVRATLVLEDGHAVGVILTLSALCADQVSASLLFGEIATQLAGKELLEDPLQYADFSAWQHELSAGDDDEARAARAAWSELGATSSPALPFARAHAGTHETEELAIELGDALTQALATHTARYSTPAAAFAQAAWHAVLGRFSGEQHTVVALVSGERRHADLEGAIGAFARPVPVRAQVGDGRSFAEVLAEVDRARTDALVWQDYAPADAARTVETGFVEYPAQLEQPAGTQLSIERMLRSAPDLPLSLMCGTDGPRLHLSISFDPQRHRRETVAALADGLARALAAVAEDPSIALGELELLADEQRERLLRELAGPTTVVPHECVHELVARWARSAPEREAVVDEHGAIGYGELDARANQVANRLRALGVEQGGAVGLCTDRSVDVVVGLLGILKAGAAYVPLHSDHPPMRLAHQLQTAGATVVLTQEPLLDKLARFEGTLLCLDRDRDELQRESASAPQGGVSHDELAYIIYTSGSTGTPKGVSVTHGNLANYAADMVTRLQAESEPCSFALVSSISTDLGNTSVFGALCSGGTLVLVAPETAADPGAFVRCMQARPVDVLKITPSHLGALLAAGDARVLPRRWLVLGGERSDWDLIERVRALGDCAILNHYGPTETTIGCCTQLVGDGPGEYQPASVPIGRPIANTSCYVLDDRQRLTPLGVAGRLFVSGAGVARGYAGADELTMERFLDDPFAKRPGARMYDTGDLVRWLPDGALEFLGRVDEQLKLRGYRVEPAEVETALRSHPQVREAVTVAQVNDGAEVRLLAYCAVEGTLDQERLRAHIADWLPEFMLPSAIVILDELPRTPSGKVDRLALPDPDVASAHSVEYVAPRTPLEEAVAAIWAQVLSLPQVGVEDDFFSLGGHSLLATQVVARIRSDFAVDLPLHSLFTYPTVASLAAEMVAMMGDAEAHETDRLMAELEGMSEEEAQRLLADELSPEAGRT